MQASEIRRLQVIDAALASRDGLSVQALATEWSCSGKTVLRALALLTELGHTHSAERRDDSTYWHRYDRGVKPLFRATRSDISRRGRLAMSADKRAEIVRRLRAGESVGEIVKSGYATYGTVYRLSRTVRG